MAKERSCAAKKHSLAAHDRSSAAQVSWFGPQERTFIAKERTFFGKEHSFGSDERSSGAQGRVCAVQLAAATTNELCRRIAGLDAPLGEPARIAAGLAGANREAGRLPPLVLQLILSVL
jgi:hypothetical protein